VVMIRFGTKTLLFAFILVALWCSTFGGYAAGRDVRASVLLVVFLAVGYAAVYSRGKQRAFWSGIFLVMLISGGNVFEGPVNKYVPNFLWRTIQPTQTMTIRYAAPPATYSPYPYTSSGYRTPNPPTAIPPMTGPMAVSSVTTNDNYEFTLALNDTIATAWTLILGSLVGLVGIWVYGSIRRNEEP
jgi:hypothetical protein